MQDEQAIEVRVTVLVLTRNRAESLRSCLEALEASPDRSTFEVLVVDNGSVDATRDVTANFVHVNTLRLPKNFGSTKALNIGIRTAKGEYVLITGPEYRVQPGAVDKLRSELEARPDAGAVCPYTELAYPLPNASALKSVVGGDALPGVKELHPNSGATEVDYPRGAPILVRRTFLTGMNFFDERYGEYWWDLELCWQIRNANKKIYVLTDIPGAAGSHVADPVDPTEAADFVSGAAAYLSKHSGGGFGFKVAAIFSSLGRTLTFRDSGFHLRRLINLVSGQKIDGTQA